MSAMLTIARAEVRSLGRNTTMWTTAILLPLMMAGLFYVQGGFSAAQGNAIVVVLAVAFMLIFSLHSVGVMTLASRRQQMVLKRWRSSPASTMAILGGTIGPLVAITALQSVAIMAMIVTDSGEMPAHPWLVGLGVLGGIAIVTGLTFAVAAFTNSAEHGMITTMPVVLVLMAAVMGTVFRPLEEMSTLLALAPGTGMAQLIRVGWDGIGPGAPLLSHIQLPLLGTVLWSAVSIAAAGRLFRWEPRS